MEALDKYLMAFLIVIVVAGVFAMVNDSNNKAKIAIAEAPYKLNACPECRKKFFEPKPAELASYPMGVR